MTIYYYIRRRLHDGVAFAKFDCNSNFVSNDILPDVVAHSESHENCNSCWMNFVRDGIANCLME